VEEEAMRAIFGVVSLLVALAVVGVLAKNQLRAAKSVGASLPAGSGTGSPAAPASGTPAGEARQIQQQVSHDVARALEQGAARNRDADR
jgi:hypothetical protein